MDRLCGWALDFAVPSIFAGIFNFRVLFEGLELLCCALVHTVV
jgi:hypothetical protein